MYQFGRFDINSTRLATDSRKRNGIKSEKKTHLMSTIARISFAPLASLLRRGSLWGIFE